MMHKLKGSGLQCGKFTIPMPDYPSTVIQKQDCIVSPPNCFWQVDNYPEGNRTKMVENVRWGTIVDKELPLQKLYVTTENFVLHIAYIDSLRERSLVSGDNVEGRPVFLYDSAVHPDHSFTQAPYLAHLVAYEDDCAATLGHFGHFSKALLLELQIAN